MKIQCSCGAKYSFDLTPEMARSPIRFVCQNCGLDSSDFVNDLIRKELASSAAPEPTSAPPSSPAAAPPQAPAGARAPLRIQAAPSVQPPTGETHRFQLCAKHPGQATVEQCLVCGKPLCRKCMELFGYVCSPLCRSKAEAQGIDIPLYAGQKSVMEARRWRKIGLVSGTVFAVVAGLFGFWFWYAWFGSVPHPAFSVRFAEAAYSGESVLCGKDQIVFLHGGTLARHDMKSKEAVWSRQLLDTNRIAAEAATSLKAMQAARNRAADEDPYSVSRVRLPTLAELTESMKRAAAAALQLYVRNQNVWVANHGELVRYDWDTGKPVQEVPLTSMWARPMVQGDELLLTGINAAGAETVTRINLGDGKSRVETIGELPAQLASSALATKRGASLNTAGVDSQPTAGLPTGMPGRDLGKPMDPAKVAEQAQRLPLPAKIALPATLANAMHQEQIMTELNDQPRRRPPQPKGTGKEPADQFMLIPSPYGFVQFSARLLEAKFVTREAMKAPPSKSVLDGNLTVTKTAEVANEILNEMQRSRGGSTVSEDVSRYQVTVRLPEAKGVPDWTGEVIGPPTIFPLKSVDVIAAGKTIVVLDQSNQQLWQSTLSYGVKGGPRGLEDDMDSQGQGPCVERGDTLYVYDQAVLTAFNLATGEVRWRIPSVGTTGLFFDDQGMMYVNTTTASPESLRYSRQIDVTRKKSALVLKVDPRSGKILWTSDEGAIAYVSGKFIYTLQWHQGDDSGEPNPYATGLEIPSHVMIKRLNPENGHVMWVHLQKRAPLDVRFDKNIIQIVFKKEVQVLKFLSF